MIRYSTYLCLLVAVIVLAGCSGTGKCPFSHSKEPPCAGGQLSLGNGSK